MEAEAKVEDIWTRVQPKDSAGEGGLGDVVTMGDGGEEGVASESERLSGVFPGKHTTSPNGVCRSDAKTERVAEDNPSVTTATTGSQSPPAAAAHPDKVIVTKVTLNALTVTFREATEAEGFFRGC